MQNNNQENWVITLLLGVSGLSAYGSYHYYKQMSHINKIKADVCGEKDGIMNRILNRGGEPK